jgi:hypothetical protein
MAIYEEPVVHDRRLGRCDLMIYVHLILIEMLLIDFLRRYLLLFQIELLAVVWRHIVHIPVLLTTHLLLLMALYPLMLTLLSLGTSHVT